MVTTTTTIDEQIDFILDKVDNDMPLTIEERRFYQRHVMGITNDEHIEFIVGGCDTPDADKPNGPNIDFVL